MKKLIAKHQKDQYTVQAYACTCSCSGVSCVRCLDGTPGAAYNQIFLDTADSNTPRFSKNF